MHASAVAVAVAVAAHENRRFLFCLFEQAYTEIEIHRPVGATSWLDRRTATLISFDRINKPRDKVTSA